MRGEEKDFQTQANEAGARCVESCREDLEVLRTAEDGPARLEELREARAALVVAFTLAGDAYDSMGGTQEQHESLLTCTDALSDWDSSEDAEELKTLEALAKLDNWGDEDGAHRAIDESPLSVEVRSGWHTPGSEDCKPEEYCILLGTGGPACRIVGDLSDYGQPESAHFEYQDWFKPWTRAHLSGEDEDTLQEWASHFYYGEG